MADHEQQDAVQATSPVSVVCSACGVETVAARLPMEMTTFAKTLLATTCSGCGRGVKFLKLRAVPSSTRSN